MTPHPRMLSFLRSRRPEAPPAAPAAVQPPASAPTAAPTQAAAAAAAAASAAGGGGVLDVYVGRQPIFDDRERLFAYELLYRSGTAQNFAAGASPDLMCTDTIIHTLVSIGLRPLTGGTPAFVNMTREFLLRGLYELFDPATVVVELLETVEPDAEVVAACEALVRKGYTLALDDFVNGPEYEPLLRLASIIKLDVLNKSESELRRQADELKPYGLRLLAERVETQEVRDLCRRLGYTLFQGYFYSRPQIVSHREMGVEHTQMVRLMNLLDDPSASEADVEDAFRSDPSLSYKLLRIVNSAAFGGKEASSIGFALRIVGRKALHRWLTLLLVSSVAKQSGVAHELVVQALARARLAELISQQTGQAAMAGPRFLVGLFSMLDVLLRMPMDGIVSRTAMAPEVKDALLSRSGPHAATLAVVEAQEKGDWLALGDAAAAVGLAPTALTPLYTEALQWARERVAH